MQGTPSPDVSAELTCTLAEPVALQHVHALTCTFGGGFSPVQVTLTAHVEKDGEAKAVSLLEIYPKDGNMPQVFPCVRFTNGRVQVETVKKALCAIGTTSDASANKLSVRFAGSTDGFGRVVVYHLGVMSQQ